ncbi:MAG: DUF2059 domain-containing protein [Hyphomicrobiales bacterium]|nr:DUF2059 domain-containing protein [Hyphomicrobiales bacterium]
MAPADVERLKMFALQGRQIGRHRAALAVMALALLAGAGQAGGAVAAQDNAAPSAAAPAIKAPTAAEIALGRKIVVDSRLNVQIQASVALLMDQLVRSTSQTKPEMVKDLTEVLKQLQPDLMKQADVLIDKTGKAYAQVLTDQELKDVDGFFASASGQRYSKIQPLILGVLGQAMVPWRQQLTVKMMDEVRVAMKKKGFDFN